MNEFDHQVVNYRFNPDRSLINQEQRRIFLKSSAALLAMFSSEIGRAHV